MALALARRYRPKRFADLLVQDHVAAVLRGAIARDRVGHGYLLTGPRGVGKTTAARILAMALNCERKATVVPPGEPCGECESCQRIWNGSANLDVVEIDAASNRGVDDARDLRERAMYAASQAGHHKVYIVDEAHMLTREAWNALLKILEEPPPGVVFVFCTTEPQKIAQQAAPVLSRLQRFDFRRITATAIRERLGVVLAAEGITADQDALTLIAHHADGGMRDALSVLDQCLSFGDGHVTAPRVREILGLIGDEIFAELLGLVVARQPAAVFPLVDRVMEAGADLVEFVKGAGGTLRALLMLQVGAAPEGLTEGMRQTLEGYREQLQPGDVLRMLKLAAEAEGGLRRSGTTRLMVETLLLRWALMDRTVDLAQVLSGGPNEPPLTPLPPLAPAGARTAPTSAANRPSSPDAARSNTPSSPAADMTPVPFTLESLSERWTELVALARAQSRFLGEALAATAPVEVSPPELRLSRPTDNPMHVETLERQRDAIEVLLSRAVGAAVRLQLEPAAESAGGAPRVRRLSEGEAKAERLRVLRGRDPALEAAAEGLDLEVIE